jgi:ATP-dependent Clp protease ATP-binding subunit ClpC
MAGLSVGASFAWQIAAIIASKSKHQYIEPEHMFAGIVGLRELLAMKGEASLDEQFRAVVEEEHRLILGVLKDCGADPVLVHRLIPKYIEPGNYRHTDTVIHRSERCKAVFGRAAVLAASSNELTCLHLLAALLEIPGKVIDGVLAEAKVNPGLLREQVLAKLSTKPGPVGAQERVPHGGPSPTETETPFLDRFGRDLTQQAREGNLGPVIGRRAELLQTIQTLARRSKNNPVLVGEAGVRQDRDCGSLGPTSGGRERPRCAWRQAHYRTEYGNTPGGDQVSWGVRGPAHACPGGNEGTPRDHSLH